MVFRGAGSMGHGIYALMGYMEICWEHGWWVILDWGNNSGVSVISG